MAELLTLTSERAQKREEEAMKEMAYADLNVTKKEEKGVSKL